MNFGMVRLPQLNISKFLEANATSKRLMKTLASLNLEQMKAFSLVTLPTAKHISVTIKDLEKVSKVLM